MPKNVLISDDSATIKKAFELTFLGIDDVKIISASSSSEALSAARSQNPDLIITDSKFGDMSGYEFCRLIKDDNDLKSIPVWIMTGPFERLDDGQYDACGAEGHVRKPYDTQRMIDAVLNLHAMPEEEKARSSYPAAASGVAPGPAARLPAAPAMPKSGSTMHGQAPPLVAEPKKRGKPTMIGAPLVPPIKPVSAQEKPAVKIDKTLRPHMLGQEAAKPKPALKAEAPAEAVADILSKDAYKAFLDSLSPQQRNQLMGIIRDVVEKVVWEVVPDMAETIVKEELNRLLKD